MRATTHHLKCSPFPFSQIWLGHKLFELRYNDRSYEAGDTLVLREFDSLVMPEDKDEEYSGRQITAQVTHAVFWNPASHSMGPWDQGLAEGWCVLSLRIMGREDP